MKNEKIFKFKKYLVIAGGILFILLGICISAILTQNKKIELVNEDKEIARSMTYDKVNNGDDSVSGTDFVKFDAFFTRDLDGDGYADMIRGSSRSVTENDILYFSLNVQTKGYLKDANIEVQGQNFKLKTAIIKDAVVAQNVISNNATNIPLNIVNAGTQRLFSGITISDIKNNINNYSKEDNKVILTGIYVTEDNIEIPIRKEVNVTVDWHGEVQTNIVTNSLTFNASDVIENEGTVKLNFQVRVDETKKQLIIDEQNIKVILPELNGYKPVSAKVTNSDMNQNYDFQTGILDINRKSIINENGNVVTAISNVTYLNIEFEYPKEAYDVESIETTYLKLMVDAYHTGYNNPNDEFENPIKSNIASKTIYISYKNVEGERIGVDILVGEYVRRANPVYFGYTISKQKPLEIYAGEGMLEDSKDLYDVRWVVNIGDARYDTLIIGEDPSYMPDQFVRTNNTKISMKEYSSYRGIYFTGASNILGDDGYIKVYDNVTNVLLHTFTKEDWSKYTKSNPYYYQENVAEIRIETSKVNSQTALNIYNIKELNDEKITTDFTLNEFLNISHIESYLKVKGIEEGVQTDEIADNHRAEYRVSESIAIIKGINPTYISTQETAKNARITFGTISSSDVESKWQNGVFVLKFPKEILEVIVNDVKINNVNVSVVGYEVYTEDGNVFVKVQTSNEEVVGTYDIILEADITADPRDGTTSENIELYAHNYINSNYPDNGKSKDIYDINGNGNIEEDVAYSARSMDIYAPATLITAQTISEYNDLGSITVAPLVAEIDKSDDDRTAKINVTVTNNYAENISEINLLGKIPFEGNKSTLNVSDLGSTFSTSLIGEIQLPETLKEVAKVYYSENENPNVDLEDSSNGWTNTPDFTKVKSYLIEFGDYVITKNEKIEISYIIEVPKGIEYNKVSYSTHAIYFNLNTVNGKLQDRTEVNRAGIRIARKYDIDLIKYVQGTDILANGATYKVVADDENDGRIAVTGLNGKLKFEGLYIDKTYILKEIAVPNQYELNEEEIAFKVIEESNGNLSLEIISGSFRNIPVFTNISEKDVLNVEVENKTRVNLIINKVEEGTNEKLKGITFNLKGKGIVNSGRNVITNTQGQVILRGIYLDEEYILTETKANGYYLLDEIKFKITRDVSGNLKLDVLSGSFDGLVKILEKQGEQTIAEVNLNNQKIPTYDLRLKKIEKDKPDVVIKGAQFRITGPGLRETGEIYTTDENGLINITGLYNYVNGKDENAIYQMEEIYPSEGYSLNSTIIRFRVTKESNGDLVFNYIANHFNEVEIDQTNKIVNVIFDNIPVFRLIKTDGETGELLPGAKFEIRDLNGDYAKNSKGEYVGEHVGSGKYVVQTDENGIISEGIRAGLYKVTEIEAPAGYELPGNIEDRTFYFGIGESQEAKFDYERQWTNATANAYYLMEPMEDGIIVAGYGVVAKYDLDGNLIWENKERIAQTRDIIVVSDGIIVASYNYVTKYNFDGSIQWDDMTAVWAAAISEVEDGFILLGIYGEIYMFNSDGYELWSKTIKSGFNSVGMAIVNDDIILVGKDGTVIKADLDGNIIWENTEKAYDCWAMTKVEDGIIATGNLGRVIKYDFDGNIIWENTQRTETIKTVATMGDVIIGGTNNAALNTAKLVIYDLDGNILKEVKEPNVPMDGIATIENSIFTANMQGFISRVDYKMIDPEVPDLSEIEVANFKVKYNITTEVEGEGGNILGEEYDVYEQVIYKDDSMKDIIATPRLGYRVTGITVNGLAIAYTSEPNGEVILNKFIEMAEDKHIVVTFETGIGEVEVNHYLYKDGMPTNIKLSDSDTLTGRFEIGALTADTYVTTPELRLLWEYKLTEILIPTNASGEFEENKQIVNYYYELMQYELIVNHYLEGTNTKLADTENYTKEQGESYTTQKAPSIDYSKYELVAEPDNKNGTVDVNPTEVTYYYKLIPTGNVIVYHYIKGTTTSLSDTEYLPGDEGANIGDDYKTTSSNSIPKNYKVVTKTPENYEGKYINGTIIVIYEYELVEPKIKNEITKMGPVSIDNKSSSVTYTVNYETQIQEYIGDATVKIVDKLPSKIDISKSNLNGGIYNEETKTITWEMYYTNINTYEEINGIKDINVSITITVVYNEITGEEEKVENKVEGQTILYTPDVISSKVFDDTEAIIENIDIKVQKLWTNENGDETKRPESIKYQLRANKETVIGREIVVDSTMNYEYTFMNLPKYKENKEIEYSVVELEVNTDDMIYYTPSYEKLGNIITVTNNYSIPKDVISVEIEKEWKNETNELHRPKVIKYQLQANGINIDGKEVTVDDLSNYSYIFSNLPKYDENGLIKYSVIEKEIVAGDLQYYVPTYTQIDNSNKIKVVNQYKIPEDTIDIDIEKIWDGENGDITKRPEAIEYQLQANGKNVETAVIVTNEENYSYKFENLPKYDENGEISYSVVELEVNKDDLVYYTAETKNVENKIIVTNTYGIPTEKIDIEVIKVWESERGVDKSHRPNKIKYQLQANGINIGSAIELANPYSYVFENLAKYDVNGEIIYSVIEQEVNENDLLFYEASYEKTGDKITITNTFIDIPGEIAENEIEKTGTIVVDKRDSHITYDITYKAKIKDYLGTAYVEIIDELPYEIDMEKSDLAGGIYNKELKNIIWREDLGIIDTRETGDEIVDINKQITVVYLDVPEDLSTIDYTLINNVNGKVVLETDTIQTESTHETEIKIEYGKVIVHHYIDGTTNKLGENEEYIDEVDKEYETTYLKDIPYGYELVEEKYPENSEGIFKKEDTVVIYYYQRQNSGKVITKYIDQDTGKEIEERELYQGKVLEEYTGIRKDILGYILVEVPAKETVELNLEDQELIYYYRKLKFDVKIEKWVASIEKTVNGKTTVIQGKQNEILKVDVKAKEEANTQIVLVYKIKVSNVGELEGSIEKVKEIIPEGFTYVGGEEWKQEDSRTYISEETAGKILQSGESLELQMRLKLNSGEYGTKVNKVEIDKYSNEPGFEDIDLSNNYDEISTIIELHTGLEANMVFTIVISSLLISTGIATYLIYIIKKRKK